MTELIFPDDFIWGAATAAYQIEGAYNEGGKGESIWDRYTHQPGNIKNNDTGDVACDHYHRYREDIEIMKEIGLESYRFSISWSRIFPEGKGKLNQKGLDFYKRLIHELLNAGISPAVTLYHWDLPQALQDKGGWENRDTAKYFNQYAETMFRELGDVIPSWITHNEPFVASFVAYLFGEHAPGYRNFQKALQVAHNILFSHGLAVKSFRESGLKGDIGITLDLTPAFPHSEQGPDQKAAELFDTFRNRWFLEPVFKGKYPEELCEIYQQKLGGFKTEQGDMDVISRAIDFLGINYYFRTVVKYDENEPLKFKETKPEGKNFTDMAWEVYPAGLYEILKRVKEDYTGDKPLYITENGAAYPDKISNDGKIHDQKRIDYLRKHFRYAHHAIGGGIPLKGYYVWSFLDNFEWSSGYSKRFGLVYIDYDNHQERLLKDSARWYSQIIENNGIEA